MIKKISESNKIDSENISDQTQQVFKNIKEILNAENTSFNKVIKKHGVRNLEEKQAKLIIQKTNKNDIQQILGPPSTKSTFDSEVYIYIERKTSSTKITKLGKKKLLANNILVLEIDKYGLLKKKNFYNKENMQNIKKQIIENFL